MHALSVDPKVTQEDLANAQSLAARKVVEERAAAAAKVTQLEEQHHIISRWTQHDNEYQLAAAQRKCFHIHRLQNKIVADVDWLHYTRAAVRRNPHQHRGTSSDMQRKIRQTRAQLQDTVQQLKEWHNVPGGVGHVCYDADSLLAENLQQPGFQMPWLQLQTDSAPQQNARLDLQQRLARCDEETAIIAREATDMVEFYKHRQGALHSAVELRNMSSGAGSAGAAAAAAAAAAASEATAASESAAALESAATAPHRSHASAQGGVLRVQYVRGQTHVLTQKLHRCNQLLSRAEHLLYSLQDASTLVSASMLPQLPVFDKRTSRLNMTTPHIPVDEYNAVDNMSAAIDDPAVTDVADFADVPVADTDNGDGTIGAEVAEVAEGFE